MVSGVGSTSSPDQEILRNLAQRIDPTDPSGYNNLGVLYFNKGMLEEAIAAFQQAVDLSPAMKVAARNLQIAYLSTGYYEQLQATLGERLRTNPEDRAGRLALARAHLASGRQGAAADLLQPVLATSPHEPLIIRELARAEAGAGRLAQARRLLERGLKAIPNDSLLFYLLGEVCLQERDAEGARAALQQSVKIAPRFGDAWHLLATALDAAGESSSAGEARERATSLRPDLNDVEGGLSLDRNNPLRYEELVGQRANRPTATGEGFLAHYHTAVGLRERGLYPEALQELKLAESAGEDPQLVRQTIAELLLVSGDVTAAADLYRALVREEERSPKLWNELGVCLHRQGSVAEAERCYQRALAIDAGYVIASNNLGVAQADQGELARARGYFEAAITGAHGADALCNLGLLALRRGQATEALTAYRAALAQDADSGAAWVGVGAVLSDGQQLDEAKHALARAIELRPRDAEPRYHLAFVLNRLGDLEGSLRETRLALGIDPFYAAPRFRLLVDLHYEYAEILAPDLSTSTRLDGESRVEDFEPGAEEISSVFERIEDASPRAPTKRGDYPAARSLLAKGLLDRALAEAAAAARAGADPVEGSLVTGEIFRAHGLFGEALERYDAALARLEDGRWGDQHSAAWLGRGWCLLALAHPAEAADAAAMVQSRDPSAVESRRLLADARLASGSFEEALTRFARLAELLPTDATIRLRLGVAARAAGKIQRARTAFVEALRLDPDLLAARVELGSMALEHGDPGEAAEQARLALTGLPGYAEASLLLASAESARGRHPAAVGVLADLLEEDPYHLLGLRQLGEVLLSDRRPHEAAIALKRVLKFDRENGPAWKLLGDANIEMGEAAAARDCWRRAIAAGFDNDVAGELEKQLGTVGSVRGS